MVATRKSFEEGHRRKFLVVIDDTPECSRALVYAARRAERTDGGLVLLYVIVPGEFQHWVGVENIMRAEAAEEAEETLSKFADLVRKHSAIEPQLIVREGVRSEEIVKLGVPLEAAVEVIASVKRHAESVARAYRRLFLEHVWHPFQAAGEPEERWPEIGQTLEGIRPLASESLIAVFQLEMTREVERTLERELSRVGGEERPRSRRRRRR